MKEGTITKKSRKVIKYDELGTTIEVYGSLSEAARLNGVKVQNIWKVCATDYKTSLGGFYYKWDI
jgi:hypothetical protein